MRIATVTVALTAVALAGCASSMSKNECRTVDWRTVGYEDGVAGRSGSRIAQHRKSCAAAGVSTDLDAYQRGRAEGLREYCQPENGFRAGLNGQTYGGYCAADLAEDFTLAYESGQELRERRVRLNTVNSRLSYVHRETARLENRITSAGLVIVDGKTTSEQRAQALLDVKHMVELRERLQGEIPQLESDRRRYQFELDEYRTRIAYRD
ncbi:MAG TPA: DUF2799 domain-containing protein [Steroidobacteraceae bacterium]|nr:DUF2799 domain-containing protein [Steroidobacteraceae bacterium]HRX88549.1 DUF2799 domain-containing protein [Steroidobacteraceae bacterium]